MIVNTSETLSRGMEILTQSMGIVEAERFIFLVKTEGFDYTKWQREYFDNKSKEEMDSEMDSYLLHIRIRGIRRRLFKIDYFFDYRRSGRLRLIFLLILYIKSL